MKKIAKKISSMFTTANALLLTTATMSFAANDAGGGSAGDGKSATAYLENITKTGNGTDIISFVKNILNTVIALAGLVCVVMLITAGYSYITAAGDEAKVKKASQTLTWAIVGLAICFIAVLLVQYILGTLLKVD